ncbi:response regulator [Myxococcus sp. MISCRS1]|jgi:CheY-like chemotaxis protein|uniref:response regulator n=1 Tax=Myxococcus TaxID=32 RepID=UPI0011444204|nr:MULTISPECIES: response regulator [Myxococcus]BDT31151.1 response regulator [Myxococcus sp. MH1]MBZ4395789.1 response regulator [Myxococcus sp. AS-1-15]MBZ4411406.1 response regulator [Myxococcus sp. XM-1-1-1]MCK8498894.1 response regulator [Myxococcus fulvus]MCY0998847.1 response regulator [Myxococcus sp. MISCRS1]
MQTVLVIDDDLFVLSLVTDILQSAGFQVRTVQSPESAFQEELGNISAILCDYNMPSMNGADVLIAMRELKECNAPFIFLTGHEQLDDLIPVAIRYGAELLPKPIHPVELIRLLMKQLANVAA